MHMADALLSPAVGTAMWVASAGAIVYSVNKIKSEDMSEKKLPIMAVSGAFAFAAQMINFSIPGTGSSGHIGGGILLASLLGEFPAMLTIAAVLIIQCLIFADGGILALGANIFNMGVIPCIVVYPLICRIILKKGKGITRGKLAGASMTGAVIGLQLGAFGVVIETLMSEITELPFSTFVLYMQPIHLAIGIVEGIITAAVVTYVWRLRPEIIEGAVNREEISSRAKIGKTVAALAILTLMTGAGLSLYASEKPDGLEWSVEKVAGSPEIKADEKVYEDAAKVQEKTALLPDYDFKEAEGNGISFSGVAGSTMTAAFAIAIGYVITKVKKRR